MTKKTGRPCIGEVIKLRTIGIRVDDEERDLIKKVSIKAGYNEASTFIRDTILRIAKRRIKD